MSNIISEITPNNINYLHLASNSNDFEETLRLPESEFFQKEIVNFVILNNLSKWTKEITEKVILPFIKVKNSIPFSFSFFYFLELRLSQSLSMILNNLINPNEFTLASVLNLHEEIAHAFILVRTPSTSTSGLLKKKNSTNEQWLLVKKLIKNNKNKELIQKASSLFEIFDELFSNLSQYQPYIDLFLPGKDFKFRNIVFFNKAIFITHSSSVEQLLLQKRIIIKFFHEVKTRNAQIAQLNSDHQILPLKNYLKKFSEFENVTLKNLESICEKELTFLKSDFVKRICTQAENLDSGNISSIDINSLLKDLYFFYQDSKALERLWISYYSAFEKFKSENFQNLLDELIEKLSLNNLKGKELLQENKFYFVGIFSIYEDLILYKTSPLIALKECISFFINSLASSNKLLDKLKQSISEIYVDLDSTAYTYMDKLIYYISLKINSLNEEEKKKIQADFGDLYCLCRYIAKSKITNFDDITTEIMKFIHNIESTLIKINQTKQFSLLLVFIEYLKEISNVNYISLIELFKPSGTKPTLLPKTKEIVASHVRLYLREFKISDFKLTVQTFEFVKQFILDHPNYLTPELRNFCIEYQFPLTEETLQEQQLALDILAEKANLKNLTSDLENVLNFLKWHHEFFFNFCFNIKFITQLLLFYTELGKQLTPYKNEIEKLLVNTPIQSFENLIAYLPGGFNFLSIPYSNLYSPLSLVVFKKTSQTEPSKPTSVTRTSKSKRRARQSTQQKIVKTIPDQKIPQYSSHIELIRYQLRDLQKKSIPQQESSTDTLRLYSQKNSSRGNLNWYLSLSEELIAYLKKNKEVKFPYSCAFLLTHLSSLILEQSSKLTMTYSLNSENPLIKNNLRSQHTLSELIPFLPLDSASSSFIDSISTGLFQVRNPFKFSGTLSINLKELHSRKDNLNYFIQLLFYSFQVTKNIISTETHKNNIKESRPSCRSNFKDDVNDSLKKLKPSSFNNESYLINIFNELLNENFDRLPNSYAVLLKTIPSLLIEEYAIIYDSTLQDHNLAMLSHPTITEEMKALLLQHQNEVKSQFRYPIYSNGKSAESLKRLYTLTQWKKAIQTEWISPEVTLKLKEIRSHYKSEDATGCLQKINNEIATILQSFKEESLLKLKLAKRLKKASLNT